MPDFRLICVSWTGFCRFGFPKVLSAVLRSETERGGTRRTIRYSSRLVNHTGSGAFCFQCSCDIHLQTFCTSFLQPSPPKNFIYYRILPGEMQIKSSYLLGLEFRAVQKAETQIKGIEDAFNGIQLGIGTAVFQITVMPCADFAQI